MTDVTRMLNQIVQGDPSASDQVLPLVDDESRKLASQRISDERPGRTSQATASVEEAYVRLVGKDEGQYGNGHGHFFGAAEEGGAGGRGFRVAPGPSSQPTPASK